MANSTVIAIFTWSLFFMLRTCEKRMNVMDGVWILIAFHVYVTMSSFYTNFFQYIVKPRNETRMREEEKMKKPTNAYIYNKCKETYSDIYRKREFKVKMFIWIEKWFFAFHFFWLYLAGPCLQVLLLCVHSLTRFHYALRKKTHRSPNSYFDGGALME